MDIYLKKRWDLVPNLVEIVKGYAKHEKEVISMRISTDILNTVDEKANQIGISRNELINQMIQYALDNMAEENE